MKAGGRHPIRHEREARSANGFERRDNQLSGGSMAIHFQPLSSVVSPSALAEAYELGRRNRR